MPVGANKYVIECQPLPALTASVFPCADISGSFTAPVITQNYLVDVSQQSYFDGLSTGFDYTLCGQLFAFGFTGLILLWWIGIVSGRIIKAI